MAKPPKRREFGKIPGWALKGDVTLQNYDLRAEFHMASSTKPATPYLRMPGKAEEDEETADYALWMQYFLRHLGGFPRQVRMFIEGYMSALNVPENTPQEFDPKFTPLPIYSPPKPETLEAMPWRDRAAKRPGKQIAERTLAGERCNVFVPTFAPQFAAMRDAGGVPGVSLEDPNRHGVWVPLHWLDQIEKRVAAWQPYTAEQLQALYGRTQPRPE